MSPIIVAIVMLLLTIGFILWNKIPLNFIMFVIPFVCMLLLGFSLTETSSIIINQINSVMGSVGFMLLFGLVYFTMLSETGMFSIIINKLVSMLGDRMNVVVIMIITCVISAVAYLTANMSTTYLIVFPIMIPMFNKYKIDRMYAFLLCQASIGAMCWLPWGIGLVNSAVMAGVSAEELAAASIPWGLCFIPALILMIVYFALRHKQKYGTLGLPQESTEGVTTQDRIQEEKAEAKNPNARPTLFWFNLATFVAVVIALAYFQVPSYLVFIFGAILISMVDYRKDFGTIWNKAGATFFNVLVMLIAICFYLAAFNAAPEGGVSMVNALAEGMTGIFPAFLMRYMFVIFLILVVPIIHFIPYQVYSAMYPLFISVGSTFGFTSMQIIAPFVCNLALATSNTPMNSATYVGCTLCDVDVNRHCNEGGVIMFFANLVVIVVALVTGVLPL